MEMSLGVVHRRPIYPGEKYGYLTVVKEFDGLNCYGKTIRIVTCECICGKSKDIRIVSLWNNQSRSCGCRRGELWSKSRSYRVEVKVKFIRPECWKKRVLIQLYEYILTTGCYKPTYFTRMNYLTKELLTLKP